MLKLERVQHVTVALDHQLDDLLRELSVKRGESRSAIVRELLRKALELEKSTNSRSTSLSR
jgi:metal-responsive CopG/Arc/MetJ family transcriptional regulator